MKVWTGTPLSIVGTVVAVLKTGVLGYVPSPADVAVSSGDWH